MVLASSKYIFGCFISANGVISIVCGEAYPIIKVEMETFSRYASVGLVFG